MVHGVTASSHDVLQERSAGASVFSYELHTEAQEEAPADEAAPSESEADSSEPEAPAAAADEAEETTEAVDETPAKEDQS